MQTLNAPIPSVRYMPSDAGLPVWSGPRAREIREECDYIPAAVARVLDTSPSNILRWELTEEEGGSEPRASMILALASIYGVPAEEFGKPVGSPIRKLRRKKSD